MMVPWDWGPRRAFMTAKVLTSQRLIGEIANGRNKEKYEALTYRFWGLVQDALVEDYVALRA